MKSMKRLLALFILLILNGCFTHDSPEIKIYFENNTCICPQAKVGDIEVIEGVTYVVVDNSTVTIEINSGNVNLCTTLVTDMTELFKDNVSFNSDIGFWDTSNVTFMYALFKNSNSFNQYIGDWDISKVINTAGVFDGAAAFNQDIGNWNTSKVIKMRRTFRGSTTFNQDLTGWCVTNITTEPSQLSLNAPLEGKNKPVWGTCL